MQERETFFLLFSPKAGKKRVKCGGPPPQRDAARACAPHGLGGIRRGLVCLWAVSGLSLVCLWSVSGLSLVCLWSVSGLSLVESARLSAMVSEECKKMQKKCKKMHEGIAYIKKKQYLCSGIGNSPSHNDLILLSYEERMYLEMPNWQSGCEGCRGN